MSSLATTITLLHDEADPDLAPDAELIDLAKKVNQFFEPKAKLALQQKRAQLTALGHADIAARTEITVLLTENGLQLGWAKARESKEIAPAPSKPFLRRILGPLYPGRKFWVMPATEAQAPGRTYTVQWPWAFWAVVLVLLAAGSYLLWFDGGASTIAGEF